MNVAEFLVTIAQRLGTDTAFSLTGGMAMHINRAVGASGLQVIYCNHEQACVAAADGYAKMHEYLVPGLAVVTSGPGVTNVMTSLTSAYHDSVPLILLAGQVKSADINRFGVRSYGAQDIPSLDLVKPIVKDALRYIPTEIDDQRLAELFASALSARKGPVFIEVPLDVQPMAVAAGEKRISVILAIVASLTSIGIPLSSENQAMIYDACRNAKRPIVFLGNGNRIAGVSRERLLNLVEQLGAPVLTTWPSTDLLDGQHHLHFGCPGGLASTHSNRILQNADLILFLGVRLDLLTTAFNPALFGKRALRIIIDIDPAELNKLSSLPNTLLIQSDISGIYNWLASKMNSNFQCSDWLVYCENLRDEDAVQEEQSFGQSRSLNARNVAKVFADRLTGKTLVATGSGYAIEGFARFFSPTRCNRLFYAGHSLGSMGMGLPNAIGAAAADIGPVICLEGDGGIMLNVQELLTLQANRNLQLAIVIFNNAGYLSISRSQKRIFADEYGASASSGLGSLDLPALATTFGLDYVKATDILDLEAILTELDNGRSRLIVDIIMGDDEYRGPAIVTKFHTNGTPYSSDIEEVSWKVLG